MQRIEHFDLPTPNLTIKQVGGAITIEPSTDGRTTVELTATGSAAEEALAATQVERRGQEIVVIVAKQRGRRAFGRTLIIGREHAVDVRIQIPRDASLRVNTVSGDLTQTAPCIDARFSTVSGRLEVRGDCSTGLLNSVSGEITYEGAFADLVAKSVSGNLTITTRGGRSLAVSSVSGDIDVRVLAGMTIDIDAKSLSGRLASEIPLDGNDAPGTHHPLRIVGKTVSGDLIIRRAATV
jgi:hypothetical protein